MRIPEQYSAGSAWRGNRRVTRLRRHPNRRVTRLRRVAIRQRIARWRLRYRIRNI
ncbi:hypothetical protein LTSEUGA_5647 [Salmonella enterica subsp. enterica serovar Uganda str. R8-3404]|uniref:Uncharacterized protein n=1 Tax=Salmonella enterica subsp. enterica serovar Uganda str. R8-3404 TaxID=913083 RepID=A0A6C8GTZ8_SALET|nr:hypothetical protein LTSEUGA_5647 [Salmonella enterica subsp. enterica serovar Uganda str. R8-3404]